MQAAKPPDELQVLLSVCDLLESTNIREVVDTYRGSR